MAHDVIDIRHTAETGLVRAFSLELRQVPVQTHALNESKDADIEDKKMESRKRLNSLSPDAMEAIGSEGNFIDEDHV